MKYEKIRENYPRFRYTRYSYQYDEKQDLILKFEFEVLDVNGGTAFCFQPKTRIAARSFYRLLNEKTLSLLVFHIGMIELISYWKAFCSPTIEIPHYLDENQIHFWKKIYFHGLGEFFYLNGIQTTQADFMQLQCTGLSLNPFEIDWNDGIIVPVGGGKDSVVSLELLKSNESMPILPFIINPRGATVECTQCAGFSESQTALSYREIDPLLLDLNARGFLNGHTPFSAMLAFHCLLIATLTGRKHIALSNEGSANESTVSNSDVNHQYSKSFEFERDFRHYSQHYINSELNYFSFLRPLHEVSIVKLFSHYPSYFPIFKSCNAGSKQDIWCGHCAKCLFAFIILTPFISADELRNIFDNNLLNESSLKDDFEALIGNKIEKPFECVGTKEEVNWALQQIMHQEQYAQCTLIQLYKESSLASTIIRKNLVNDFQAEHFLLPYFEDILKTALTL